MIKEKSRVFAAVGLLLVIAFVAVFLLPNKVMAEEPKPRLISVTGEATTELKPDMAAARFGVENTAVTAQEAQRDNAQKMTAVINALAAQGIPKDDIQTSNFSVNPVYEWHDEKPVSKQVLVGFRCNNTVAVRLYDLTKVGNIIDAAAGAGANSIYGISFGIKEPDPIKNDTLAKAVKNAREKANIMASAAGVTITAVHSISDGYYSVPSVSEGMRSDLAFAKSMADTPIESGSVAVTASVRVEFEF